MEYSMIDTFRVLKGTGQYWALVLISIIFIYIENKKAKKMFFSYILVLFVLFLNPFFDFIINKFDFLITTYYRTFWLIPIAIVIPYSATKAIDCNENKKNKIIVGVMLIICIAMSGVFIKDSNEVEIAKNEYKMPGDLVDIIDIINEDCEKENPKVMMPSNFCTYARQYDDLQLVFGWSTIRGLGVPASKEYSDACRELYLYSSNQEEIELKQLEKDIEIVEVDYMVVHAESDMFDYIGKFGFEEIGKINGYYIIKR